MMKTITPILLMVCLFLGSCKSASTQSKEVGDKISSVERIKGDWYLIELNGKVINTSQETLTINFNTMESRVAGMSGCNRFFGSYIVDDKEAYKLSFSKMGSTMMACPSMDLEREYLNMFETQVDVYYVAPPALKNKMRSPALIYFKNAKGKVIAKFKQGHPMPDSYRDDALRVQ